MNNNSSLFLRVRQSFATALVFAVGTLLSSSLSAGGIPATLDDFSHATCDNLGFPRMVVDDSSLGGQSHATLTTENGVLRVEGELVPARGQPAFVSLVLLLSAMGEPQDLSGYQGIRIKVRVTQGALSVLAASTEIQNFDFHCMPVARTSGDLREIKIPFADMKRMWSEQTPLNLKTIGSINLVASGVQKAGFAYEVDEIGFY